MAKFAGIELTADVFHNLVEAAPDAMVIVDADGRIVLINTQTERLFGWVREELLGQKVELLIPERFHDRHIGHRSEYSHSPRPRGMGVGLELYGRRKDGTEFPIEISLSPVKTAQGLLVSSAIRDISERKRTEAALEASHRRLLESEQHLAEAQEVAHIGSWTMDVLNKKVTWSDELQRILGLKPQQRETTLRTLSESVHPDDRAKVESARQATLQTGTPLAVEHRIVRPDGEVRIVHARGRLIVDEKGKPARIVGTTQDITEYRRAETDLARHAEELARSNAELEQFAYIASHDLQEPLRTVSSYTQLLVRRYSGKGEKDADEFAGYITEGVQHMRDLIEGLLAYSRVSRQSRQFEATDLNLALETALIHLKGAVETAVATISHDSLPTLRADARQLVQLFQNLVGNALKFRGQEPPRVHVGAEHNGKEWVVWVRDNGIGIDPQHAERIFVLFQRLHTRDQYPGSGLGLAICKKIVERHGGRIWVEPGNPGSVFRFTLPAS